MLLAAKTSEISEEMHKEIAQAKAVAHAEGMRQRNGAYYPLRLIVLEEEAADAWARKLYDAALEIWQIQGHKLCRPFLRAVYSHLLAPILAARRGAVTAEMQLTEVRTGTLGQTSAYRSQFVRAMDKLQHRWNTSIEVAARKFEYAAQREERSKAEEMAVLSVPNLIPEQPRTPAKKRRPRLPKAQVLRRQVILGVLELELKGLHLKGLHYCRELDERKLPTPTRWQEDGCPATYAAAYRDQGWAQSIQHEKSNFNRPRRKLGAAEVARIIAPSTRSAR